MTPHTEAERAAFEAWAHGYGTWEVKRDDDVALGTTGYTDITLTVAWHAVQAARRAPEAPTAENIREGAPYDNPAFEQLARDMGAWGTPQAALCAQFWLAALAQRAPLTKEEISEIMKLVGKYGTAVEANSTGNPSDYTLALEEARAFDAVRFRLLTIERDNGLQKLCNSQQT